MGKLTKNIISCLELRVDHFVGESSSADSNTSKHTIALVLVHNKSRFNTSGNLVSVGHNTTDEVGLSLVEGAHQVVQLTLEVGGDCLSATLLLPTTVILIMTVLMMW